MFEVLPITFNSYFQLINDLTEELEYRDNGLILATFLSNDFNFLSLVNLMNKNIIIYPFSSKEKLMEHLRNSYIIDGAPTNHLTWLLNFLMKGNSLYVTNMV